MTGNDNVKGHKTMIILIEIMEMMIMIGMMAMMMIWISGVRDMSAKGGRLQLSW